MQSLPHPLNIDIQRRDGLAVIYVAGEIDMQNSLTLRARLQSIVADRPGGVIIHLAEVTYVDSSGLAVLIECFKWCESRRLPYCLARVPHPVMSVLKLAYLTQILQIADSLEEALQSCKAYTAKREDP